MKKILLALGTAALLAGAAAGAPDHRSPGDDMRRSVSTFSKIITSLQAEYVDTLDADRLTREAIDAMLAGIDPYTEYYSEDEIEELTSVSTGKFSGIGSAISARDGYVYLAQPSWGNPAREAGIRHGDRLLEIDGEAVERGAAVDAVSKKLRGPAGSTVRVKVLRPWTAEGADSVLEFEIIRREIVTNPLPYYGVDSAGVGYIRLTTFNDNSARAVGQALEAMKRERKDLRGLVLDLRGNGGGVLQGAVGIVGLFVPKGTLVVRTLGRDSELEKNYRTTTKPVDTRLPLAVMIDGGTASASEIVAGALQDLDRAVIVGERSFGKGLVQSSRPIDDGLLKLTVARYYIPSGRLIQAIDYSHRNDDGSPARIPDSLTRVWSTTGGREVRDGGGITPDLIARDTVMNRLIYNAVSDYWVYDFANRYRSRHESIRPDWQVDDSVFAEFKAFIDPARFKYDRMCEAGIDYLRNAARVEGYMSDSVTAQIDLLANMLRHDLEHDLNFNRPKLTEYIDAEISDRYFDEAAQVRRALRYDAVADTAVSLILNPERYRAILTPANKK